MPNISDALSVQGRQAEGRWPGTGDQRRWLDEAAAVWGVW